MIALAEGRTDDALARLRTFDDGHPCETCTAAWIARAHDAAGRPDSAMLYYTRLAETPSYQLWFDAAHLVHGYRRLGELYEARGERARAADYYSRALELWRDPDPEFQAQLDDIRRRLERLGREGDER